jgi:hypothetical protein
MAAFSLEIFFTPEQLDILKVTGNKVVIGKAIEENPNVAWQVIEPIERNVVTWDNVFGIYASDVEIENGVIITQLSKTPMPAEIGKLYTLENDGSISGPTDGGVSKAYTILNEWQQHPYMTVGLYEDANVNGVDIKGNTLSANPLLLMSKTAMTVHNAVYIWLQPNIKAGDVVTYFASPLSVFQFNDTTQKISVTYDEAFGRFEQTNT